MIPSGFRFIADVHLGKLARHLRMVGFDTIWRDDLTDPELLRISSDENRILLTRDRVLANEAGPSRSFYVTPTDPGEQLREVVRHYSLQERVESGKGFLSRCLECNSPILPVQAHQVADRLPGHVRLEFNEFFLCPRCERVYWKGSHFERMREWVRKTVSNK